MYWNRLKPNSCRDFSWEKDPIVKVQVPIVLTGPGKKVCYCIRSYQTYMTYEERQQDLKSDFGFLEDKWFI